MGSFELKVRRSTKGFASSAPAPPSLLPVPRQGADPLAAPAFTASMDEFPGAGGVVMESIDESLDYVTSPKVSLGYVNSPKVRRAALLAPACMDWVVGTACMSYLLA